jgi:serine/threonine protein kinase
LQLRGDQLDRGSIVGGYRIDGQISRGGMGIVYRATNVALNRIYALKVLTPELAEDDRFRERFKREMRIAASLHHPNVVAIHYAGEHEGLLFFVMDFVSGSDLRDLLKDSGAIEPHRAVDLLAQFASALDAAHERGLVHRDVKPANILITVANGEEHSYLTDFGIAKRFDTVSGLTAQGAVVGTVDYMAPEQISGGRTDARTDIYALACVFFQMLTGRVPYERENSVAKLFAHVHEPPPPLEGQLAELYPTFGPVLKKAMAKEPADRYLSAGDFARDAAAALAGTRYTGAPTVVATGEAKPPGPEPSPAETSPAPAEAPSTAPATVRAEAAAEVQPSPITTSAAATVPAPPPRIADPGQVSTGGLRRFRWAILAGALVLVAAVAVVVVLGSSSSSAPTGEPFAAAARPVPTNHVTGSGTATLRLHGTTVTVSVVTTGLLNGSAHAMHIHAGGQGICPPASAARLHNGHLSISTTDGLKFYGPPEVALTNSGDTSPKSILAFARYPSVGSIHYTRTIQNIPAGVVAAIRAGNAVIVVHGIDYNGNGIYDNVLDRSELNNALPGEATAPALCGPVFSTHSASVSPGGAVYTASVHTYPQGPDASLSSLALVCHIPALTTGARESAESKPPASDSNA